MSQTPEFPDRFEISRILGKGGMGTVYLARDVRLGRPVAIKVLNLDELTSAEARGRFLREARLAAAIRHQNVATIHEVGETPQGQPFIVMEFCEGETLAQRIRRKPLDAMEFLHVARQLASGLAAAHETGVVHRDLKAPNIIIEPSGTVKILDFGLAKLHADASAPDPSSSFATTSGQFFGTLHYLAPEQARGGAADERSDLFALGVVFYQMASGKLPFNADAPLLVLERIRDAEPEPFEPSDPAFGAPAAKIISKLLQKDPADRYQSARDLLVDLDHIETPTLRMSTQHSRSMLGPTVRRPHTARVLIAFLALLLVGAAVVLIRQQTQSAPAPVQTSPPPPIRSMAVLPLTNLAKKPGDEFLSVGLADALVTKLQQIPSLQVRPTSAVLEFHEEEKVDAKTAGEKLQVDGILEGHFLAAGDLVRVNLQLTDSRTGYGVWSTTVDGKRDNLLKLIDDVSARTVDGLNSQLGVKQIESRGSEARSSKPEAYEQYLKARSLTGSFVAEDYNAQVAALKRAIRLDPDFAAAYADLAITLSLGNARSLTTESIQQAETYARQAVRLDPNLAQAHLALGRVFVRYPDRYRESVREILAALRINANDTHALNSVATYFVSTGDMQNARCIGDRIMRLDPSSNESKMHGYWFLNAVDPEGTLEGARYALQSKDTELAGHDLRANAFILQGNLVDAEKEADIMTAMAPRHYLGRSVRAMIAAAKGDREAAETQIKAFEGDASRNHWAAIRVALVYGKLGDREKALAATRRAVDLGHHSWNSMVKHPWLQSLQAEPEYQAMLAKIKSDLDDVRDDVIGVYQLICGK